MYQSARIAGSRVAAALALCSMLTACGMPSLRFDPPTTPSMTSIKDGANAFNTLWAQLPGAGDEEKAKAFVKEGYRQARENCTTFFTDIKKLQRDSTFAKDTLVTVAAAAGVISGLAGVGRLALTTILGVTGAVPAVVDNFATLYLFRRFPTS